MFFASKRPSAARFWLIAFGAFALVLWALRPMLLPFVAGMALAYFLNPPVTALARRGFPRWGGTLLVLAAFVVVLGVLILLIAPLLQSQIVALVSALPDTIAAARDRIMPWAEHWMASLSHSDVAKLREAAGSYAGTAVGWAGNFLKNIITEGAAIFNVLALVVITPVVAFYLLRDWPKIVRVVDGLLPRHHADEIRGQLALIDRALSGFIRGQALVCLSLGLIYGLGLTLAGLKYGATVGIIAGALSFVPYVGSTFGCVASLLLAFVQFDDPLQIAAVFGVFLFGQGMEGYVLTPKLVGDRVGLHPVWILFALFAGGSLLGFVGVLIAVPTAAIVGVLTRYALSRYRQSRFYYRGELS